MSFRAVVASLLTVVLGGSVAARAWNEQKPSSTPSKSLTSTTKSTPNPGSSFLPGVPPSTGEIPLSDPSSSSNSSSDDDALTKALPYVTEASFFGLVGLALGYFTRKVVKVALFLLGGIFLLIQGLSYAEVITVDWQRAVDLANTLVLNIKENESLTEMVKNRIPTAGGLIAGFALGYRRG